MKKHYQLKVDKHIADLCMLQAVMDTGRERIAAQRKEQNKKRITLELPDDIKKIISPVFKHIVLFTGVIVDMSNDMQRFDFRHTSSVSGRNNERFDQHLVDIYQNKYDLFSTVNLYEHTLHVLQNAVQIAQDGHMPQVVVELYLVMAMAHDFGKSALIRQDHQNSNSDKHEYVSANYIRYLCTKHHIDEKVTDGLALTISIMHTSKNNTTVFLLNELRQADAMARHIEFTRIVESQEYQEKER